MTKTENMDVNVEMQIKAIELLHATLQTPNLQNTAVTNFNFNISTESKVDAPHKLVFVITTVEIRNDDQTLVLGTLAVSCIFEILNFADVIKIDEKGNPDLPQRLLETLNVISISTVRGVMFSTYKGTFLHGAVLPIIDPKQFRVANTNIAK